MSFHWSRAAVVLILGAGGIVHAQSEERQRYEQLLDARRQADSTIWAEEREALKHEATFVALWDDLRAAPDGLAVLAGFEFGEIRLGDPADRTIGALGIRGATLAGDPRTLDGAGWAAFVNGLSTEGYRLIQTEFHHADFGTDDQGRRRSTFSVVLNLSNVAGTAWYDVTGPIEVTWSSEPGEDGRFLPASIDVTDLVVTWRTGSPFFEESVIGEVVYPANYGAIIARDLNGDGLSEILCPTSNAVFRNRGDGRFEREPLCDHPVGIVLEGLVADFTGDGEVDLLVAGSNPSRGRAPTHYSLFLYHGDGADRFRAEPLLAADPSEVKISYTTCLTAGDVDGDGDLDLFVSQYLQPYVGGQFPTPYFDANDGLPAYLLLNDGAGRFADATESAGLAAKRNRRTFRASFVDLDEDGDLDLLVVSDFAGIDVYANDGSGQFTDVTSSFVDLATNFGMAHTFGDFNTDGFLDLFVTGMASTTARRLHAMGLGPEDRPEYQAKRMEIGYGNRMYLRRSPGRYGQPDWRDSVARSGWSWGCATIDFDSDGYPDLYIANGNKSGASAQDYCTTFWCHDIYSGSSSFDDVQFKVYLDAARPYLRGTMSWNGFEHNHLLMNRGGGGFANVGFLVNTAIEADCRGVLVDDFDADGRPDLLVDARADSGDAVRELRLLMNRGPRHHNWVGVRLVGAAGVSTLGARITVGYADGKQAAVVVAGDSYGVQHAPMKHFGLGQRDAVDFIKVEWPDGSTHHLARPAINQYHTVSHMGE